MTDLPPMSDDLEFPEAEAPMLDDEAPEPEPRKRRVRWQIIVLIAGIVLILGAILYGVLAGPVAVRSGPITTAYSNTQTYTEAVVGSPQWVNPLLAVSQTDRDLVSLVYSGLTRVDDYGQPTPDLAERWEVSADGLIYTFHLRQNVLWHDGQPFTAEDVAFTASLLRDPEFPGPADLGSFWQTVETYADDPSTVRFVLTQPLAAFPEYASVGILPAHILGGIPAAALPTDPFNLAPIGTGRLRWLAMEKDLTGGTVRLEPFSSYYEGSRSVQIKEVDLRFFNDPNRALNSMDSGTQAYGGLTPAQLNSALTSSNIQIFTARMPSYNAIIFNQGAAARLPFFQDRAVRTALMMSVDRKAIVQKVLPGNVALTDSTVLPGSWGFNPAITPQPFDPTGASAALDAAGWPLNGGSRAKETTRISFTLLVADGQVEKQIGQAVVDGWRAIGIDAKLQAIPAEQLVRRLSTPPVDDQQGRTFDAALVEFTQGRIADPDPYPFWHESQIAAGQNLSGMVDRDISEDLELAREDGNGVQRAELYRAYQQLFQDHAAAVLLYNPLYHYAVSCQIANVQLMIFVDPSDRFRNMQDWRVLPPEQAEAVCPSN